MKHATSYEYIALIVAMMVLLIVLVSSFMCIQLYRLHKPPGTPADTAPGAPTAPPLGGLLAGSKESFGQPGGFVSLYGPRLPGRVMPSIDLPCGWFGGGLCCGRFGGGPCCGRP